MAWLYATAIGVALGVAAGFVAERVPVAPILQSVGAALAAMVLGAVAVGVIWFVWSLRPPDSEGLGAVSIGIGRDNFLFIAGLAVFVAGLHLLLGRVAASAPAVVHHRAIILGCVGGLCGALSVAWALAGAMRSD